MFKLILLFLTLIIFVFCVSNQVPKSLDINELSRLTGHQLINYQVQTSDGYLLTLFHVQNGHKNRPAVLVMHGLLSNGMDFDYGNDESLVRHLLGHGFDVFLGNTRGSLYGMGHTTLDPDKDPEFWNFSFDEIATKDLPALVDMVLEKTGQPSIGYVGHMEGTTIFYMMLAELDDYVEKINCMIALGPMVFMKNSSNKVLRKIIDYYTCKEWMLDNFGESKFTPSEEMLLDLNIDCQNSTNIYYRDLLCTNNFFLIKGYNSKSLDADTVLNALPNIPFGGSVKQMFHLAQMMKSGRFQKYSTNWPVTVETREYELKKVNVPTVTFYTTEDSFSHPNDVQLLVKILPQNILDLNFSSSFYNNIDFIYSRDRGLFIYDLFMDYLKDNAPKTRLNTYEVNNFSAHNSLEITEGLHPNAGLHMADLVHKYNYPLETHQFQTEDGYILTVFRIPHGRNEVTSPKQNTKPVIMLMHGLLSSSIDWVNSGSEKGLGFILADAGYDVWFGNQRGNINSRKHIHLDIKKDQEKFFNFSFHEIGYYDIPATIDYILNTTQEEKIYYVGHSQGSTAFFVMASDRPEYNEKIHLMAALAPVAYINHAKSPVVTMLALFYDKFITTMECIKQYEFLPYEFMYYLGARKFCNGTGPVPDLCTELFSLISGYDFEQWDPTFSTVVLTNVPAGSSLGQHQHYLQLYKSKKFQHFDYGPEINQEKYGSDFPPLYDLAKITAQVALYYGQNDWLSSVKDVDQLKKELPNIVKDGMVPYEKFNHLDFLWANDVVKLLYKDLLNDLQNYSSQN